MQPIRLLYVLTLLIGCMSLQTTAATISGRVQLDYYAAAQSNLTLVQDAHVIDSVTADEDGYYSFDDLAAGDYLILANYQNYNTQSSPIQIQQGSDHVVRNIWMLAANEVQQPELFTISGVLSDYSGNVYAGAKLTFTSEDRNFESVVYSDSEGQYEVKLPDKTYIIGMEFSGYIGYTSIYYTSTLVQPPFKIQQDTELNFTLPFKEININATVNSQEVPASLTAQENSSFDREQPSETEYVYVELSQENTTENVVFPTFDNVVTSLVATQPELTNSFPTIIDISNLTQNADVEIINKPLSLLGIQLKIDAITDLKGNLLEDACVYAQQLSVPSVRYSSCDSSDGNIYLSASNYNISIGATSPSWANSGNPNQPSQFYFSDIETVFFEDVQAPITVIEKDYQLPIYAITGKVTDNENIPLTDVLVTLENTSGYVNYTPSNGGEVTLENSTTSDENGEYSLYVSPLLGNLTFTADADSMLIPETYVLKLHEVDAELSVTLNKGSIVLSVKVENLAGIGIPGEVFYFYEGYRIWGEFVDGSYRLVLPEAGEYSVNFSWFAETNQPGGSFESRVTTSQSLDISESDVMNIVVPIFNLTGTVMDVSGLPIPGFEFSSSSKHNSNVAFSVVSNFSGLFDLPFGLTGTNIRVTAGHTLQSGNSFEFAMDNRNAHMSVDVIVLSDSILPLIDTDSDGVPDYYEALYDEAEFDYNGIDAIADYDSDNINNLDEYRLGTDIYQADTDNDGIPDDEDNSPAAADFALKADLTFDGDGDGFSHLMEFNLNTDPFDSTSFPQLLSGLNINDSGLRECINELSRRYGWDYVTQFTDLDCSDKQISNIAGLENFTLLVRLNLSNNQIKDISALSSLKSFYSLDLSSNQIVDIDALEGLEIYYSLDLSFNQLVDISVLSTLTSVRRIYLEGNDGIFCIQYRNLFGSVLPDVCINPPLFSGNENYLKFDFENAQVDNEFLQFSDSPWTVSNNGFESEHSLQTTQFNDANQTSFSLVMYTEGGLFSFDYQAKTESCCNYLNVYLDGQPILFKIASTDWKTVNYLLDPGEYTFKFEYANNLLSPPADDGLRIDNISLPIPPKEQRQLFEDLNTNAQTSIARLWLDTESERYTVDIQDITSDTLLSQINWVEKYDQAVLHIATDLDNDGTNEVGLFGQRTQEGFEGKLQFFVKDTTNGARVNVYNWPANWTNPRLIMLPDLNGDEVPEVAIQGQFKQGNRPQLVVKDGANASNLRVYQFPDLWDDPEYLAFSDVTGDGVPEIALFGRIKKNGKPQIRLIDGTDSSNKLKSYTFPNNWENISWNRLSDSNGDGADDWGLFGQRIDDGRSQLIVKDARDPKGALRIYAWTSGFENAQFYSVPDMNNDDIAEVAAGGYRNDIDRYQLTVKHGTDRNVVMANYGWPNKWSDVSLHVLGDMTGDTLPEFALFGLNLNNAYEVVIKNGDTEQGELLRWQIEGAWTSKPQLHVTDDLDGDALVDLVIFAELSDNKSGNIIKQVLRSSNLSD